MNQEMASFRKDMKKLGHLCIVGGTKNDGVALESSMEVPQKINRLEVRTGGQLNVRGQGLLPEQRNGTGHQSWCVWGRACDNYL